MSYRRSNDPTYVHENYLRYGSKRAPALRGIHEVDTSLGLILGFRGRESSVPPGYCTRLQNVVPRNDGTYGIRPPIFIGPEFDPDVFDTMTRNSSQIIGVFPDGGVLRAHGRRSGTEDTVYSRTGYAPSSGGSSADNLQFQYGNAAHWGNTSLVPYTRFQYPEGEPYIATTRAVLITYNDDLTLNRSVTDLTDMFGHNPYVYEDVDDPGSVYSRTFALTWKGRGFILAGTGVSYSAPLQPGTFTVSAGGGFIPLDTNAPITGAFILHDIMYICTEAELFTLMFDTDPGRSRNLRVHTRIQCFGALEHDNIGYIATSRGLYRILNNQMLQTFIPSEQSYYAEKVTGDTGGAVYPLNTDSVQIPRVCGIHRFGDLLVLAGLDFNADRRFGTPSGDTHRYPAFSTATETWVEWTGPDLLDGGLFAPVNALTLYQGPLTPDYGFPASHTFPVYYKTTPHADDKPSQAFLNINSLTETITMLDSGMTDPNIPVNVTLPPYIDVGLEILFPNTANDPSEDEIYAINTDTSTGFEVFVMTGRLTFGMPFTWKRMHRYWIDASLYGVNYLPDNSFMMWDFYSPFKKEDESFEETVYKRFDRWLENSHPLGNQTPGHLVSEELAQKVSRFTSLRLALYWRSPLTFAINGEGIDPGDFNPQVPKWVQAGISKIYADITEYKPVHIGI